METVDQFKILLAEDNPDHAELTMETILENGKNIQINHVQDGQECLDFLFNQGKYTDVKTYLCPDLILLDIRMPKKDGLEVLKAIKTNKEFKKLPVVMLTTSRNDEEILSAYEYGANTFVSKPIAFEEFAHKITQLQIYWKSVAEMPKGKLN